VHPRVLPPAHPAILAILRALKLRDLADRLGCRLEGDGDLDVVRVAGLEDAGPDAVSFYVNPRYLSALRRTRAAAVILGEDAPEAPCAMLRSAHPYLAFAAAVALFADETRPAPGVDPRAFVAPDATLGPDVSVGPFVWVAAGATIGARTIVYPFVAIGPRARIGADCILHSHVAIRERVVLGDRVIVQNGAVIGSDGFGFAKRPDGTHQKIPQAGDVVIEDDVEIGANTTIDRPAVGETRVGAGTKIDNLVQIAHGVRLGRNVLLAAQVGIAGSTVLEDDVVLAGQVGVAGHLTIGRGAVATAQTGIPNDVPAGALVSGYPAVPNREWRKTSALLRRLPELKKTVADLEARVAALEARLAGALGEAGR
jgi:UDP-3-O-[3-hydroxymyristoyl] glucosamine N-acyltransferase